MVIYDGDNNPEMIHAEYHPWKSKHTKLISNDVNLNKKILNSLV